MVWDFSSTVIFLPLSRYAFTPSEPAMAEAPGRAGAPSLGQVFPAGFRNRRHQRAGNRFVAVRQRALHLPAVRGQNQFERLRRTSHHQRTATRIGATVADRLETRFFARKTDAHRIVAFKNSRELEEASRIQR